MFVEAVTAAELGFESVWFPEHLVLPLDMSGSPFAGAEHPPVPPSTPVFDVFAYLAFLAGRIRRVRLGTHVYNLGLGSGSVSTLHVLWVLRRKPRRAVSRFPLPGNRRLAQGQGAGRV